MVLDVKQPLLTRCAIEQGYDAALKGLSFVDIHVHDMPDCCGEQFALVGPDATIDYHYAYGEYMGGCGLLSEQAQKFWAMKQSERVDLLAKSMFCDGCLQTSEARKGILTAASVLGLPTSSGDFMRILREWREMFRELGRERYTDLIFERAGITHVVSTQSPFVPEECQLYLRPEVIDSWDSRYWCGLRWDEFALKPEVSDEICKGLMNRPEAAGSLSQQKTCSASRKLLEFWISHLPNVKYVALSLPGWARLSRECERSQRIRQVLSEVIIPVARERKLPVFLMPYVRRGLNANFRNAGDCVERGEINDLIEFISCTPDVVFAVTPLDENDNYPLSFAARALPNLRIWGHWWGNLNPVLIEQQLRLRMQMNGYVHFGVNSDARIRDQLLFKWPRYFRAQKKVLVEEALDQIESTGFPVTIETLRNSIIRLQDYKRVFNYGTPA